MTKDIAATPDHPRQGNGTLWLILAVCLLPFVASTALYYFAQPKNRMNYGDLIAPPAQLPDLALVELDGKPLRLSSLRGKWTMVQVDGAGCSAACLDKLYKMRQVRLTQGKNMNRVQRLWIIDDTGSVSDSVLRDYAGTIIVRADNPKMGELMRSLPATAAPSEHIWLVDPLGNVMLRYPPAADPSRMKNDLTRVLRVSRIE